VKDRLENFLSPAEERLGGITKGALAVMHKQVWILNYGATM